MRLWSFHPRYLDPKGLVALWRESLLALAVLQNKTSGYKNHPQLERFKQAEHPIASICFYLMKIYQEAENRNYNFNQDKIPQFNIKKITQISVNEDQLQYEWNLFKQKLQLRNKDHLKKILNTNHPSVHPLFRITPGPIADWERLK